MQEGYFEVDLAGNFTFVNDAVCRIFGHPKEELIGMNNRQYADEKSARELYDLFNGVYRTGEPVKGYDLELIKKDGTKVFNEIAVSLMRDSEGKAIGFRGITRDVKERKKAEEALREREEKYRTLLETMEEGYSEVDLKGNLTFVNDALCKMTRRPRDQLIGVNNREYMDQENAEKVFEIFHSVYKTGQPIKLFEYEITRRGDGAKIYQESSASLMRNAQGKPIGFRAIIRDITERKRAEEALRRAQEILETRVQERTVELVKANNDLEIEIMERRRTEEELKKAKEAADAASRAKSEFLANMSHELRTPLNHIIGFTELVVDKQFGALNKAQEEYLNDVLRSSRHLLSLINDILDLSKVEAGKLELEVTDVNLRMLLESSLTMVKEKALKHRIQLSVDIDSTPGTIQADERKLKQIMYNLLSNAVKFTPDGGAVTLLARHLSFKAGYWLTREGQTVLLPMGSDEGSKIQGGLMEILVQDTGIGISRGDLERIFDPFERVESLSGGRHPGTGLGLSLTRRLVELHGGKIWAESEGEGKGSKFIFVIPA
jgi:PAS domain S-box-containing protein